MLQSSKRRCGGVGAQSVRRIAEKNGGACTFAHQDGVFSAKVMLRGQARAGQALMAIIRVSGGSMAFSSLLPRVVFNIPDLPCGYVPVQDNSGGDQRLRAICR